MRTQRCLVSPCLASSRLATSLVICACIMLGAPPATAGFVLPPMQFSLFCLAHPADCDRRNGRADAERDIDALAAINNAVNDAIAPIGKPATSNWEIDPRAGDCGDYAVSKRHALLAAGWPSGSLLLAEVVLRSTGEHHLLLIVRGQRSGDPIRVLDNLREQLMTLSETQQHYALVRVQSSTDPQLWQASLPNPVRTTSPAAPASGR